MGKWEWVSGPYFNEDIYWERHCLLVDGDLAATVDKVSTFDSYVVVDSCGNQEPKEFDLSMPVEEAMRFAESMARMMGWR